MTVAKPPHNNKLGIVVVSLTKQKLKPQWDIAWDYVEENLEKLVIDSGYLKNAPFSWVTIAVRYGLKYDDKPYYQKINKKYGDLPLAIEIDTRDLLDASVDELKEIFSRAVLISLIHAGKKYNLPIGDFEKKLVDLA